MVVPPKHSKMININIRSRLEKKFQQQKISIMGSFSKGKCLGALPGEQICGMMVVNQTLTWPMAKRLKLFGITYLISRENKPFKPFISGSEMSKWESKKSDPSGVAFRGLRGRFPLQQQDLCQVLGYQEALEHLEPKHPPFDPPYAPSTNIAGCRTNDLRMTYCMPGVFFPENFRGQKTWIYVTFYFW